MLKSFKNTIVEISKIIFLPWYNPIILLIIIILATLFLNLYTYYT